MFAQQVSDASKSISHDTDRITLQFVNHMFHGIVKSALSLLDVSSVHYTAEQ